MRPTAARRTCSHLRVYLALLPSGPDAVRRLGLHRVRAAVRRTASENPKKHQVYYEQVRLGGSKDPPYVQLACGARSVRTPRLQRYV